MKRKIITKKEALFLILIIIIFGSIITAFVLFLPSTETFQEPTIIFEIGELTPIDDNLYSLQINITCFNDSIILNSVSGNPCVGLGIYDNNGERLLPLNLFYNITETVNIRCEFQNNVVYLIEFHFQIENYEFTKVLKYEN